MASCSLIIFTCEGREHLLKETIVSFRKRCNYNFDKVILAIDGKIDQSLVEAVDPGTIVQSFTRKGYVNSIQNAIRVVDSEFFFWLEDDWVFNYDINVNEMILPLASSSDVIQFVLGKEELLSNGLLGVSNDVYESKWGFSANPCICRSKHLKEAFELLRTAQKNSDTRLVGFEKFLSDFIQEKNLRNLIRITQPIPQVSHSGYLESTAREYHMINSMDDTKSDIGRHYISGLGSDIKISLQSKLMIMPKLLKEVVKVLGKVPKERKSYDMALRTFITLNNFNKGK